jgi:hypothetical protein
MRNLVRSLILFAAGIVVGAFLMQPGLAQQNQKTGLRLNHVGIYAKDYDESMRFYTQTIGLKEAFTIKDAAGKPTLSYLQIQGHLSGDRPRDRRTSCRAQPHWHLAREPGRYCRRSPAARPKGR